MSEFMYTEKFERISIYRSVRKATRLTAAAHDEEHDVDERRREDRDRDQAHDGVKRGQETRVEGEQDEAVEDGVGAREARARGLEEVDEGAGDPNVRRGTEDIDGLREHEELGELGVCAQMEACRHPSQ